MIEKIISQLTLLKKKETVLKLLNEIDKLDPYFRKFIQRDI